MANHRISSTRIKTELQSELNVDISKSTIKRRAHETGRVTRKKIAVKDWSMLEPI